MPRPKPEFETVPILLRLRPETLAELDAWAKANSVSRSEAVRHAISAVVQLGGLAAAEPRTPTYMGEPIPPEDVPKRMKERDDNAPYLVPPSLRATLDAVQLGPAPYVPRPKKGR